MSNILYTIFLYKYTRKVILTIILNNFWFASQHHMAMFYSLKSIALISHIPNKPNFFFVSLKIFREIIKHSAFKIIVVTVN